MTIDQDRIDRVERNHKYRLKAYGEEDQDTFFLLSQIKRLQTMLVSANTVIKVAERMITPPLPSTWSYQLTKVLQSHKEIKEQS